MKKKRIYTEKIHAQRIMQMFLNKSKPCAYCPAQKRYGEANVRGDPEEMWSEKVCPCEVCGDFIELDECPCKALGEKEAIELTWRVLKEKGYLK